MISIFVQNWGLSENFNVCLENVRNVDRISAENRGFGVHTLTTHEHNGHNPAESDGYTQAFFFPGQYWDYLWPMTLAGSATGRPA